jgi:DNA polymerase-1
VYRCGFAAEKNEYHLILDGDKGVYEMYFAPQDGKTAGAQMKEWMTKHPDHSILDKEHVVIPEPAEHALEAVRTQLYSIEKECRDHYEIATFDSIELILSGPGNYREALATVFPYKGNRDPDHKPHWYQQIRNYLTGEWGARVVSGREADDECSILARKHLGEERPYVVATIDKDLDQIPGEHYNYMKQVFYAQSESEAERFFLEQCVSGDATDGIPGCYKSGPVRAAKLVQQLIDSTLASAPGSGRSQSAAVRRNARAATAGRCARLVPGIWDGIVAVYAKSQRLPGCPYVDRDPATIALETARLVKLQEYEGQLWRPDGPPHDLLPEYQDAE